MNETCGEVAVFHNGPTAGRALSLKRATVIRQRLLDWEIGVSAIDAGSNGLTRPRQCGADRATPALPQRGKPMHKASNVGIKRVMPGIPGHSVVASASTEGVMASKQVERTAETSS